MKKSQKSAMIYNFFSTIYSIFREFWVIIGNMGTVEFLETPVLKTLKTIAFLFNLFSRGFTNYKYFTSTLPNLIMS